MCPAQSGIRPPQDTPPPWRGVVELATSQGGAIARAQALSCGLSLSAIQRRRRRGDLEDRHPRVYAIGPLTRFGEHCAAALAAGERGALGLWSAAAAVNAAPWPPTPQLIVVGGRLDLDGVGVHRTRKLPAHDVVTNRTGIRATWWPRTVTDLAEHSSVAELQSLLDNLERASLFDAGVLQEAMEDANGKRGLTKLNTALEPFTTITEAEYLSLLERFTAMVLEPAGIHGEVNGRITLADGTRIRIDVLLRTERLAIEVDGRDSHTRTLQFDTDRWRDRELQKLGYRVLRFTWQDVMYRPARVLHDIRALLPATLPGQ